VLQIASNAFIKSAKSIAQLLQFSIKSASNMLQMWLTSNSFKSEPNQRCKASPATVLQMLQKITNCFKYASTMLHLLQEKIQLRQPFFKSTTLSYMIRHAKLTFISFKTVPN
jgi:hypothetical protein